MAIPFIIGSLETSHTKAGKPRLRTVLALLLLSAAIVLAIVFDAVVVSLVGFLLGYLKLIFNLLSPKSILLSLKNGSLINLKNYILKAGSVVLLHAHRPWRRSLKRWSELAMLLMMASWARYRRSSIWLQWFVAAALLVVTIGTGYSVIAVFALPNFILKWIWDCIRTIMDKLGVAAIVKRLWEYVCPVSINERIKLFSKWRVGRFQISMARKLRRWLKRYDG